VVNTAWAEPSAESTAWARNSGIDTSVPTYDDSSVTYDQATEYYDGYNANIITEDDVKFSQFTDAGVPANAAWTDVT